MYILTYVDMPILKYVDVITCSHVHIEASGPTGVLLA
jgi:hypothetical protein